MAKKKAAPRAKFPELLFVEESDVFEDGSASAYTELRDEFNDGKQVAVYERVRVAKLTKTVELV